MNTPHYQSTFFVASAEVTYDDVPAGEGADAITRCTIRFNGVDSAAAPILIFLPYLSRLTVTK